MTIFLEGHVRRLIGRFGVRGLIRGGQVVDVLFEGLVVLAFDLQLGLEFFYEELETGYFGLELHDVGVWCWGTETAWRGGGCGLWREGFGQGAWPGIFRRGDVR